MGTLHGYFFTILDTSEANSPLFIGIIWLLLNNVYPMEVSTEKLAARLLEKKNLVILDLETTGLLDKDPDTKIVQITLMNGSGKIVFSSLVNPQRKIPPEAMRVHGIKDSDVANAPKLEDLIEILKNFLDGASLVAYNAGFDVHLLTHRLRALGAAEKFFLEEVNCAMEMYQHWSGSRKWLRLPNLSGRKAHDSVNDCYNTLLLLEKMAGKNEEKEVIDLDF